MVQRIAQRFLVYSFLGWILEESYHWIHTGMFRKTNFLHGPWKPMYGLAGVLITESYRRSRQAFPYVCLLCPIGIEWVTGVWLHRFFRLRFWDYRKERFQLGGYICAKFTMYWIVLSQFVTYVVSPCVEYSLAKVKRVLLWKRIYQLFLGDCIFTICWRRIVYLCHRKRNRQKQTMENERMKHRSWQIIEHG